MTAADMIPQPCGRIFDEMVMLQKIRGDQKTFAELADSMMSMVLHEGTDSQRIDAVFDVYRNNSIKNHKNFKVDYKMQKLQGRLQNASMADILVQFQE